MFHLLRSFRNSFWVCDTSTCLLLLCFSCWLLFPLFFFDICRIYPNIRRLCFSEIGAQALGGHSRFEREHFQESQKQGWPHYTSKGEEGIHGESRRLDRTDNHNMWQHTVTWGAASASERRRKNTGMIFFQNCLVHCTIKKKCTNDVRYINCFWRVEGTLHHTVRQETVLFLFSSR